LLTDYLSPPLFLSRPSPLYCCIVKHENDRRDDFGKPRAIQSYSIDKIYTDLRLYGLNIKSSYSPKGFVFIFPH